MSSSSGDFMATAMRVVLPRFATVTNVPKALLVQPVLLIRSPGQSMEPSINLFLDTRSLASERFVFGSSYFEAPKKVQKSGIFRASAVINAMSLAVV